MTDIMALQRRNMYLCLVMALCSPGLVAVARLGAEALLGEAIAVMLIMTGYVFFFWGGVGFFAYRKRLVISHLIETELLAHWTYDTSQWWSWLAFNRTYEKLDIWNGKGYIFGVCILSVIFAMGFLGNAITGVLSAILIAAVLLLWPILNSLIYRKKQKNPEVYLSRYGAYVSKRRILIPKESVEGAKALCESLSASFTYAQAMSLRLKSTEE